MRKNVYFQGPVSNFLTDSNIPAVITETSLKNSEKLWKSPWFIVVSVLFLLGFLTISEK